MPHVAMRMLAPLTLVLVACSSSPDDAARAATDATRDPAASGARAPTTARGAGTACGANDARCEGPGAPAAPPAPPAAPSAVCPGKGLYCGGDGVQGGAAKALYACPGKGLAPTSSEACAAGCQTLAAGTNDVCAPAQPCPTAGDYCGDDGLGGAASILYHCAAAEQAPASSEVCAAGCRHEPSGTNDACVGNAPSGGACSALGGAALAWEAAQLAAGNAWSDLCLGFVNQAYAHAGNSPAYLHVADANTSLDDARATGQLVPWGGACPCGAILYWASNACNAYYGHVVICNGDGTASTSGWPGYAGSPRASIAWLSATECGSAPAGYIVP